jgi:hypothetical protein
MSKWIVIAAGIVGILFLVNAYIPEAWFSGIRIFDTGYYVPWAFCILGAFLVVGFRLKSK